MWQWILEGFEKEWHMNNQQLSEVASDLTLKIRELASDYREQMNAGGCRQNRTGLQSAVH
jgi:hypothetical protein